MTAIKVDGYLFALFVDRSEFVAKTLGDVQCSPEAKGSAKSPGTKLCPCWSLLGDKTKVMVRILVLADQPRHSLGVTFASALCQHRNPAQ